MVGWIILGALVLIVALICLTPVGVDVSYVDSEFRLSAKAAWVYLQLFPKPEIKPKKEKPPKPEKEAEAKEQKPPKEGLPLPTDFTMDEILELARVVTKTIGRFRKKLCINHFRLWFVSSDPDPYVTVLTYNLANQLLCAIGAMVDGLLRVKHCDIRTATDFNVGKPFFECALGISIRIGQAIAVVTVAAFAALKILLKHKKKQKQLLKEQAAAA